MKKTPIQSSNSQSGTDFKAQPPTRPALADAGGGAKDGRPARQYPRLHRKAQEVDITGVEPTAHAFPLVNVTRPDQVRPSLSHENTPCNAPAQANGLFIVPKIVE